ncbi:MAG: heat-inducible transcription repressor HrcA [Deltaproteobacteria bacterium]|nr:heat-inducible transcription repressor HrcA [Deltaproteobacteria bacterium]
MENLTTRHIDVLQAVVEHYIRSGEPVGSRTLSRSPRFKLSPATLRNVMADLEEGGYLCQPHTSAGRIPTDRGFRFYVNHLPVYNEVTPEARQKIRERLEMSDGRLEEILHDGVLTLAQLTPYVGVVSLPDFRHMVIRHIRFVKLSGRRVLAVVVSVGGAVQNVLFEVEQELTQDQLNRYSNYLNAMLGDLTLAGIKRKIFQEMAQDKEGYDELFAQVLALSQSFFAQNNDLHGDVMLDGKLNLLEHPEFADVERMKAIFKAFEEKGSILKILDRTMEGDALRVIIGSESECDEMRHCSLVTAAYGREGRILGQVGVIGPTRMDYSRVIPLVNYLADVMSQRLQN